MNIRIFVPFLTMLAACSGASRNDDAGVRDLSMAGDLSVAAGDLGHAVSVVVNEVNPNGPDPATDPDWIELKNVGSTSADLTGYTLRDSKPSNAVPLPSGSVIAPGAYLVINCRGNNDLGATSGISLDFKLSGSNGDEVHLATPAGVELDTTSWTAGAVPVGQTWSRLPDGTGAFAAATPTRGDVNKP